jgi:hypothetical protein
LRRVSRHGIASAADPLSTVPLIPRTTNGTLITRRKQRGRFSNRFRDKSASQPAIDRLWRVVTLL